LKVSSAPLGGEEEEERARGTFYFSTGLISAVQGLRYQAEIRGAFTVSSQGHWGSGRRGDVRLVRSKAERASPLPVRPVLPNSGKDTSLDVFSSFYVRKTTEGSQ